MKRNDQNARLHKTLETLYQSYVAEYRKSRETFFIRRRDPILFPLRYKTFEDQEAAAFLAATFAYGNVRSLCGFVEKLLKWLGPFPATALKNGKKGLNQVRRSHPYYRLHKSEEILSLLEALSHIYQTRGSLYAVFQDAYYTCNTMKEAISIFVASIHARNPGIPKFLVPSPAEGSACKRLNLFLRWMVRPDEPDLGLWNHVSPAHLIMPVDTHIGRIAYRLGWIQTPSLTWQKAETITAVLRQFDQNDPTRYDFALCHESIARSDWLKNLLNESVQTDHP